VTIHVEPDDVASVASELYDHRTVFENAGAESLGVSVGDTIEFAKITQWREIRNGDLVVVYVVRDNIEVLRLAEVKKPMVKLRNADTGEIDLSAEAEFVEILGVVRRIVNRERDGENYWRGDGFT
jgi:hypothetical protein